MDDTGPEALEQHRHVGTLDSGELLDVLIDQVRKTVKIFGPSLGAQIGPRGECVDGRCYGLVRSESISTGNVGKFPIPVQGRANLEGLIRGDSLSTDVVIGGDGDF